GWQLEGWKPSALQTSQRAGHDYVLGEALKTWQWWALWMLLFLNTCAGIAVISQEAPIFQELTKVSAVVAGGMVGIASLGNAAGRVFWAWVSDLITRMRETAGSYSGALHVIAVVMAISILLPILMRPPRASVTAVAAPQKKFA